MQFRSVKIGQWFDFVSPNLQRNSFYSQCQKVSARKYRWKNPVRCSLSPAEWLETRVGTIKVEVYNYGEKE